MNITDRAANCNEKKWAIRRRVEQEWARTINQPPKGPRQRLSGVRSKRKMLYGEARWIPRLKKLDLD